MPQLWDYGVETPTLTDYAAGVDSPSGSPTVANFTWQSVLDLFEASGAAPASFIASGTFDDARISQSSVTQHEAALTITSSQVSDLGTFLTDITNESIGDLSDVALTTVAQGDVLVRGATGWINLAAGTDGHFLQSQGAGSAHVGLDPAPTSRQSPRSFRSTPTDLSPTTPALTRR